MKKWIFGLLALLMVSTSAFGAVARVLDGTAITVGSPSNLLTLPATTDQLVGRATNDNLTNKTMSGASNTFSAIPVGAIGNGSVLSGSNTGDVTISTANGLSLSGQALSLATSSASTTGALTSTDWSTFNGKLSPSLTSAYIFVGNGSNVATGVNVTGDVTIDNTGVTAIGSKKVVASMLGSGISVSGTVATADGSGGVSYQAPQSIAPALNGGSGSPQAVTAAGGVVLTGITYDNFAWVVGSPGAVVVTATPSITACTADGQKLHVIGTDATKTVTLQDNAGLSGSNLQLNGTWVGGLYSVLNLYCDITLGMWVEESRR